MQLLLIIALVIAVLAVVFALQNAVPISVAFLVWKFETSLALVLLIALASGFLMGLLASAPAMIKRMRIISNQMKKIRELERDLQEKIEALKLPPE